MRTVTIQIPLSEYGPLATLAAAANMPIDEYVVEGMPKDTPEPNEPTTDK